MARPEKKVVIVALGNEMRGDDGAGILFGKLVGSQPAFTVVIGGEAPENHTGSVIKHKPEEIFIVDAMDFGGKPGECRVVSCSELQQESIPTHGSLKLFAFYLEKMTGADICVLGFQPKNLGLGESMSPEVSRGVREIARHFPNVSGRTR